MKHLLLFCVLTFILSSCEKQDIARDTTDFDLTEEQVLLADGLIADAVDIRNQILAVPQKIRRRIVVDLQRKIDAGHQVDVQKLLINNFGVSEESVQIAFSYNADQIQLIRQSESDYLLRKALRQRYYLRSERLVMKNGSSGGDDGDGDEENDGENDVVVECGGWRPIRLVWGLATCASGGLPACVFAVADLVDFAYDGCLSQDSSPYN